MAYINNTPYLDVAQGLRGTPFYISGYNADVDNVREDLWECGGTYVFPTVAQQMRVVSTDANDTSAGTGIRTVDISYLDGSYVLKNTTVTLNGTTPVNTSVSDIFRILHFHALTVGSNGTAVGKVELQNTAGTVNYSCINATNNLARSSVWTVPAGKTAYITSWNFGVGSSAGNRYGEAYLRATCDVEGTYIQDVFMFKSVCSTQDGSVVIPFTVPLKLPEKTDIKISAISDSGTSNAIMTGGFQGWYE
jgi:hypothetical protein